MSDSTTSQDTAAMPPASDGSVGEPAAWGVFHSCGFGGTVACYTTLAFCKYHFPNPPCVDAFHYEPLYRQPQPTLTEAEREAIYTAALACEQIGYTALPSTLRDIAKRLK